MEQTQPQLSFVEKFLAQLFFYRKQFALGAGLFLAAVVLLFLTLYSGFSSEDHLVIKRTFVRWEENLSDMTLFDRLSALLKKHPKLAQEYEPLLVQKLIQCGSFERAASYVEGPIEYLWKESPEHASFAETTLLIEKGLYQDALEKASRLKEQMGREESFLYVQNLLRIASLQKSLQNGPGEISAWRDCEECLASGSSFSEEVLRLYREKNVDLKQYIKDQIELCTTP